MNNSSQGGAMTKTPIAKVLKKYKRLAGLRYEDIATLMGCSERHLYSVRQGEAELSLSEAAKLAQMLGVSLDLLYKVVSHQ